MRVYPVLAMALFACSPDTSNPDSSNPDPSKGGATTADVAASTPIADDGKPPQPGELKTFADWTVGCDNVRRCQANALMPEAAMSDGYLMMVITRDAGPDAPMRGTVPFSGKAPARLALAVDGESIGTLSPRPDGSSATLTLNRARASQLANGSRVMLSTASGAAIDSASLKGLAAALLYIDDRQQRVGTTSAMQRPGSAVSPAAPSVPTIAVSATAPAKPRVLSVAAATKLIGRDNAVCDYAVVDVTVESYRLDATHSLALVSHPCGNGAYNMFSSAFIVDEEGKAVPAQFDWATGMGSEEGDQSLVNAGWDDDSRRLSTYAKGRGIGDCGSASQFVWDGLRFRLTDLHAMGECRGSTDFIRLWTRATRPR